MMTPEQRPDIMAEVRQMLDRARPRQIRRLPDDIRRSAPILLEEDA